MRDSEIWRAALDGTNPRRIAAGHSPAISPDGRWIAYLRVEWTPRSVAEEIRVMPTLGGSSRVLRHEEGRRGLFGQPIWSPDSRSLVVSGTDGLLAIEPESGDTTVLQRRREGSNPGVASFSPDGTELAFDVSDSTGADVYVLSLPSGALRRLTDDGQSAGPVWGPRGIAFARHTLRGNGDIWLMDGNGKRKRRLTRTSAGIQPFAFSDDGRRLLAFNPAIHNGRLWAVDVERGESRDLTGWVGDLFPLGLSRDGSRILARVGCGALIRQSGSVERISFANGKKRTLAEGPCVASWNA